MRHVFTDRVESISEDRVVRFVTKPGGYRVVSEPGDVFEALKRSLRTGQRVEVTFDPTRKVIEDALAR